MLVTDIIIAKYGDSSSINVNLMNLSIYKLIDKLIVAKKKIISSFVLTAQNVSTLSSIYLPVSVYDNTTGIKFSLLTT